MLVFNNATTFNIQGNEFRVRLRLHRGDGRPIAVLSDIEESGSLKLNQYALGLPEQIVRKFDLDPHDVIWFAHYPRVVSENRENFMDKEDIFEKWIFEVVNEKVLEHSYPARDSDGNIRLLYPCPPITKSSGVREIEDVTGEDFPLDLEVKNRELY